MKTIYIANDGKQFYDEYECIQYERGMIKKDLEEKVTEPLKIVDIPKYSEKGAKLVCIEKEEDFPSLELFLNNMAIFHYKYSIKSIVNQLLKYFKKSNEKKLFIIVWYDNYTEDCPIDYEVADSALASLEEDFNRIQGYYTSLKNAIKELGGEVDE